MEDTRTTIVTRKTMQKESEDGRTVEEIRFYRKHMHKSTSQCSVYEQHNELKTMIQLETKKSPRNEPKDVLENKVKLLFSSFENVKRRAFPNKSEWLNYVYQVARWTKYNLEKMNDPIGNHWQFLSLRYRVAKALEEKDCSNLELFRQEYDSLQKVIFVIYKTT